jgi:hypothetical protein
MGSPAATDGLAGEEVLGGISEASAVLLTVMLCSVHGLGALRRPRVENRNRRAARKWKALSATSDRHVAWLSIFWEKQVPDHEVATNMQSFPERMRTP